MVKGLRFSEIDSAVRVSIRRWLGLYIKTVENVHRKDKVRVLVARPGYSMLLRWFRVALEGLLGKVRSCMYKENSM